MDPKVTSAQIEKDGSALVMAVSCHGMFDLDSCNVQPDSCALPKGAAFAFIKAVQTVNQRLLGLSEKNKTLLFEVVLLGKDCEEHIKLNIFDSAKHYGLEIDKFYFCSSDNLIGTLQANHINLFLSPDKDDVYSVLKAGVPAALLYQQAEQQAINRLKVLFSGDLIGLSADSMVCLKDRGFTDVHIQNFKAAKECLREFVVRIGEMKRMFGHEGSPLHTSLMTVWGSRDVCASALKTLRGWGLDVDEAFCLAGATCGPILALLQPHIVWDNGLHNLKGVAPLLSS
ncbi:cytosolic 5'-nucleotidase 1B isoform X1 [Electrophorus electricus]|uniref:cytosolic 5'-nucleotidase 1B isoform X1 n=2 Tax=Electrophorus electricus TaxID=8005 RepID=UPI0015CFC2E1|nr:cytosolic 5'-nucleotidase 1B isoform X1 [Electrophorus electricus]